MSVDFLSSSPPSTAVQALWSANLKTLDITKHKKYIIHQVLQFGDLEAIRWLFSVYGKKTIRQLFVSEAEKVYTPRSLHYISKYVLGINPETLDHKLYVANI